MYTYAEHLDDKIDDEYHYSYNHIFPSHPSTPVHPLSHTLKFRSHDNAVFDLLWIKQHSDATNTCDTILSGSGDQTLKIWNIETQQDIVTLYGHVGSVKSVSQHTRSSHIFASGSRDGSIGLWDDRCDNGVSSRVKHTHLVKNAHVTDEIISARNSKRRSSKITPGT
jgi:WD40 repeat protein